MIDVEKIHCRVMMEESRSSLWDSPMAEKSWTGFSSGGEITDSSSSVEILNSRSHSEDTYACRGAFRIDLWGLVHKYPWELVHKYPWEAVEERLKVLREEAHGKDVARQAQGSASNTKTEEWTKTVKYETAKYTWIFNVKGDSLGLNRLVEGWTKLKVKARTIPPCEKMAHEKVAESVAQIESGIDECLRTCRATREAWRIKSAMYHFRSSGKREVDAEDEVWIEEEATRRIAAEDDYIEAQEKMRMELELRLKKVFAELLFVVAVSDVALLSFIYQYLFGYIDRGGTKTYSPGSLEFRATYVSILLFQGAYVWIKFRDVASSTRKPVSGVFRRSRVEAGVTVYYGKYEPRFKPPRVKLAPGESLIFNRLALGAYDTEEDAKTVHQIAAFYYGKGGGRLDLGDGRHFSIDSSRSEKEMCLDDMKKAKWVSSRVKNFFEEKEKWVTSKTKAVFEDFKKAKAMRALPSVTNGHTSVHSGEQIINARDSSCSVNESGAFSSPAIYKSAEELQLSFTEASPLVESSADGERRILVHGPGVDKELIVGGQTFRPVEPGTHCWRSSNVNQNLSGPMLVPTSAEQCPSVSGGPSVHFDHSFLAEEIEMWTPPDPRVDGDVSMFLVDDLSNIPEGPFELPDMQPLQHLQENHSSLDSASAAQIDDHNPSDTEPVVTLPALGSEGIPIVVQESSIFAATSNKVDDGALIVHEGALHISQTSESPPIDPLLTPQQGSIAVEFLPAVATPSATNLCPTKSVILDTATPIGKLLSVGFYLQEQAKQIQERDREKEELEKQNEELKKQKEELKKQNEELKKQNEEQAKQIQEQKDLFLELIMKIKC